MEAKIGEQAGTIQAKKEGKKALKAKMAEQQASLESHTAQIA